MINFKNFLFQLMDKIKRVLPLIIYRTLFLESFIKDIAEIVPILVTSVHLIIYSWCCWLIAHTVVSDWFLISTHNKLVEDLEQRTCSKLALLKQYF